MNRRLKKRREVEGEGENRVGDEGRSGENVNRRLKKRVDVERM